MYVNKQQDNWVKLLPNTQFVYNSARQESTGVTPFFANKGYEPVAYTTTRPSTEKTQSAMVQAKALRKIHTQLIRKAQETNEQMKSHQDQRRSQEPSLEEGDKVYL